MKWIPVKDGNPKAREIFGRHYTYNPRRDQMSMFWQRNRNYPLIAGPGEKLILLLEDMTALFVWRKFKSMDEQTGISCSVFRNEGLSLSSGLIRAADEIAWERWPADPRHYTYVNGRKVSSRNPGYCFLMAGWNRCGVSKRNQLIILEISR